MVRRPPSRPDPWLPIAYDAGGDAVTVEPNPEPGGDRDALQDDCPGAAGAEPGALRAASRERHPAGGAGAVRDGSGEAPPGLGTSDRPREAGRQPEPDRERSTGVGSRGADGLPGFGL